MPCSFTITALLWLRRAGQVPIRRSKPNKIPHDRREAPPLPLWRVTQRERRILPLSASQLQIIVLECFLTSFSDLQRINASSCVFDGFSLLGLLDPSPGLALFPLVLFADFLCFKHGKFDVSVVFHLVFLWPGNSWHVVPLRVAAQP